MKKLLFVSAAVGLLFAVASVDGPREAAADTAVGNQVTICHFNGHAGDFVTFNRTNTIVCNNEGGNAIRTGVKACKKGHRANEARFRTCDDGDLQG